MNISQRFLLNNGLSEEKQTFYENLANRYSKISLDYIKKNSHEHSNFNKKVLNWLFNQTEENRMLLCAVENKKYTNTIHDAYCYIKNHHTGIKFRFSEEDNKDEEKFKYEVVTDEYDKMFLQKNNYSYNNENYYMNKNPYFTSKSMKELKNKDNEFLENIIFYQSESPIDDKNNYNSYFTLKKEFLKNEEIFKHSCNILSYGSFLSAPIMIKKDVQNKTTLSFGMPYWITNDMKINPKININYEDDDFPYTNTDNYFSLSQYCLALIEQVLCVRYLLYNQNKNLNNIISSIYLNDLLDKKEKMLGFLNSLNYDNEKFYEKFGIDEINIKLFYDKSIDEFVKNKDIHYNINNMCNDNINYNDIYIEAKKNLNICENKDIFEGFYDLYDNDKKRINQELINKFLFFHVKYLFTYEDFSNRLIFEKIYTEYSNKICDDLIMDDEKKAKEKKKKKKKKNNENKGKNNLNEIKDNNEENKKNIFNFVKNLIYEKLNKKLNECQEKENINNNININNNKKNNKKEKEFFLYQPTKKKNKKKGNNKKNKNNNNNSHKNENINIIKEEKINNNNINLGLKNEIKIDNKTNNIIINTEVKKEYKEDKNVININYPEDKIKEKKNTISKNNNIPLNTIEIQSHINSFTLSSSANSSTSSDSLNYHLNSNSPLKNINLYQNEIYDNNNLFVVHQNPISYQKIYKLTTDIINFNTNIESLLVILREIKLEIKNHFEKIIKKVFKEAIIEIYGSSLYKLDIESSDLDLSISTKGENNLEDLVIYLNKNNKDKKYLNINFISTASIPIIKLDVDFLKLNIENIIELNEKLNNNDYYQFCKENNIYGDTNIIRVDISLNSINYKQLNFIEQGIKQYPQIIYLIKILKKLLLYKHMNNSYKGGMSSYCLFLILYSYLKFYSNYYQNNSLENNYGSLLIGFLFYYIICIDFKYTIINPLLDNPFKVLNFPIETIPTIIEPTTKKNAGKNIYRIYDVIKALNEIYRDIYIVLKKDYNNESDNYIYELFIHYIENK